MSEFINLSLPKIAELAKQQYQKLFEVVDSNRKAFQDFDLQSDRLDRFCSDFIGRNGAFQDV